MNKIFYGPPGTGKTYAVKQLLNERYTSKPEDLSAAEWRAQFIHDNFARLKWWEVAAAALYEIGGGNGEVKVSEIVQHPFIQAATATRNSKRVENTLWGTLQRHAVDESTTVNVVTRGFPRIFDKTVDSSWKFAGEWQEHCSDLMQLVDQYLNGPDGTEHVKRYEFVTFHQSYGYEEFVEGLRPTLGEAAEESAVQYEIRPGVFKELCTRARLSPDEQFAIVIDEINRGNIAKIFGELITLIEPDKREGAENSLEVKLAYSGDLFSVPQNVDIIGTMNTADRSLALLDTALRRRFEFEPVYPDSKDYDGSPLHGLYVSVDGVTVSIPRMLTAINQRIETLYDLDHSIGHAYFVDLGNVPDGEERLMALKNTFEKRIMPLLEEYFFEDWQKIRLVLADNQKPIEAQFIVEISNHDEDLVTLFGPDHGLDSYSTKRRFAKQDQALVNPRAYVGIYSPTSLSL